MNIDNYSKWFILALAVMASGAWYQAEAAYTPSATSLAAWDVKSDQPGNVTGNGSWATLVNAQQYSGNLYRNDAAMAQDDSLRWSVSFPDTQPRTLYVRYRADTDRGIITVSIDGVNASSTIDTYGSANANQIKSIIVQPARNGKNAMQFWMATKNGASSNYGLMISEWWLI